ncbi:hypothetical protein NY78_0550 [Desulfovibrio sp. TomC]|nr:hypothetical protein NY78_0550 [Desulfovibrio sp. TomC]
MSWETSSRSFALRVGQLYWKIFNGQYFLDSFAEMGHVFKENRLARVFIC